MTSEEKARRRALKEEDPSLARKQNVEYEKVLNDKGKVIGKRSPSGTFIAYKPRGRGKKFVEQPTETPQVDAKQKIIASLAPKERSTPKTVKVDVKQKINS
jgi:hypothetical protein